jgi:cyclopropane-fatty-acyl-phospholipid synthase
VGVTISSEQAQWAKNRYRGLPLEFRLQDYREIRGKFDRVVSIGMFEHVGRKNYRTYMEIAANSLEEGGLFLLHTIGKNDRRSTPDPWIDKYIFPNGDLPSCGQIGDAVDGLFVVEDLHNFGSDYDKTLMAWHANFEAAWPEFESALGQRFYRMWRYYLLSCAGAFRARDIQLWQWVLSKNGVHGGYRRVAG